MSDESAVTAAAIEATNILKRINRTSEQVENSASNISSNVAKAVSELGKASASAAEAATHSATASTKATESTTSAGTTQTKEAEATASASNAKKSADLTALNAQESKTKADEAKAHTADALNSATQTKDHAKEALTNSTKASDSAAISKTKEDEATTSAKVAKEKEGEAIASATVAKEKETEATNSATIAKEKEEEASTSATVSMEKEKETSASAEIAKRKELESDTSAKEAKRSAKEAAEAHNLSTTAGLAGAFNVKADDALLRMGLSAIALFISLAFIGYIGYSKFDEAFKLISDAIAEDKVLEAITAQILFFLMGIGAPVWLAWMSTRMMSKYFQLSEDYSYKASLAKAYIGFKKQADGLDPIFEERLFAAAITQLDANPLRFFEESSHPGSPIQDLLNQPFMIAALKKDSFRSSISKWMNDRFKTNFHVERTDILDIIPKASQKAADKISEGAQEIADQLK